MNLFRKTILTIGVLSILSCTFAFADEVATNNDQNAEGSIKEAVQGEQNEENLPEEEQDIEEGMVTADILNVRSGPSTDTEILGKLYLGTTLEIISKNEDKECWYEIEYDSKTAYVCGEYVNIIDDNSVLNSILTDVQNSAEIGRAHV